ncbi:hypothetical protein AM593_03805, partial [Mytilus galloprovincialis]
MIKNEKSVIRMKLDEACRIIIACGILHNIVIMRNEHEVAEEQLIIDNQPQMPPYNGPFVFSASLVSLICPAVHDTVCH